MRGAPAGAARGGVGPRICPSNMGCGRQPFLSCLNTVSDQLVFARGALGPEDGQRAAALLKNARFTLQNGAAERRHQEHLLQVLSAGSDAAVKWTPFPDLTRLLRPPGRALGIAPGSLDIARYRSISLASAECDSGQVGPS